MEYDEDGVRVETRGRKRLQYPEWYEGFSWDDPVEVAWTVGHWRRGHVGLKRKPAAQIAKSTDGRTILVADPKGGPYRPANFDGTKYSLVVFQPKGALWSESTGDKRTVYYLSAAKAILDDVDPKETPRPYVLPDYDSTITPRSELVLRLCLA